MKRFSMIPTSFQSLEKWSGRFSNHWKLLALVFVALGLTVTAQAQYTDYWRAESDNGNWYTAGGGDNDHWWRDGGSALNQPDNNAILIFDNDTETIMNNNGSWSGYRIIFESNCTETRYIEGNAISFYDYGSAHPKIENLSDVEHMLTMDIVGDATGDPLEINPVMGNLSLNGALDNNGSDIQVWGDNMKSLNLNGDVSGSGKLIVKELSYVYLSGLNTFTGHIEIDEGAVILSEGSTVGAGTVYIGNGDAPGNMCELALTDSDGGSAIHRNIVVNYGDTGPRMINMSNTIGTNQLTGTITLNGPLTVSGAEGGTILITNLISGAYSLRVTGDKAIIKLTRANTYEGGTIVGGAWLIAGDSEVSCCGTGAVLVNTVGGGLGGAGFISGPVTVQANGQVRPGEGSDFTTLTISNNLTLSAGSTNYFDLSTSSSASDRIDMKRGGSLTLGGAVDFLGTPFSGATYVIVTNIASRTGTYSLTNGLAAGWSVFYGDDYIYVKESFSVTVTPSNGPYAGGNTVTITNGNFGTITNVMVGGVVATIQDSGANWVRITIPAVGSMGAKDVVIQTSDNGNTTLAGAYTVNYLGVIGSSVEDWTQWHELVGLPIARYAMAAGSVGGELYVAGGLGQGYPYQRTNTYHYTGNGWEDVAGLPRAMGESGYGVYGGSLYAVGGSVEESYYTNLVYRFDGTAWTPAPVLPASRAGVAVGLLNSKLYAIGGSFSFSANSNVYCFDGTSWTEVEGLPARRYDMAAATLGTNIYAMGGYGVDFNSFSTNVYKFDGTSWTEVKGLPMPLSGMRAGVLAGQIYIVGGLTLDFANVTNVFRFDGTNWTDVIGLPMEYSFVGGVVHEGAFFAIGGAAGEGTPQTNVYCYPWRAETLGVEPSSGSGTGGYPVVITGSNLCDGTLGDVTNVTLAGFSATVTGVSGSTQIVVTAGIASGSVTGDVRVYSTSYGETVKSNAFSYIQGPVPGILVSGPAFGPVVVGAVVTNLFTVTNSGTALLEISDATNDGPGAAYFNVTLPVRVEAGTASNFPVVFTAGAAGTFNPTCYTVNNSPNPNYSFGLVGRVFSLSSYSGPYAGGNTITITNGHFGTITNVLVGGVAAVIQGSGDNWVTITIPAVGSAGAKDVVVQTSDNGDTTLAGAYTVNPAGVIYDNVTPGWSDVVGLPEARYGLNAGVLNGRLYAIGGVGSVTTNTVYRYDVTNWTQVASMPQARLGMGVGTYSGALYAAGGVNGTMKAEVMRFDGSSWTTVSNLPSARGYTSAGVLGGLLYVVAGRDSGGGPVNSSYAYNGNAWSSASNYPLSVYSLAAATVGTNLYGFGGYDNSVAKNAVYGFDGTTWNARSNLPALRRDHGVAVANGLIYCFGGRATASAAVTNAYRFDGSNWRELLGLPAARMMLAAAELSNVVYAVGGHDGVVAVTNVYRYADGSTGMAPSSGSWTGGYTVVITGTNLCDGTLGDVTNVTLCGAAATVTEVSGSTQIVVTAGVGLPGVGDVRVCSVSFGESVKADGFTYTGSGLAVLGTNGAAIASGEAASAAKGTAYGLTEVGTPVAHTFSITNSGNMMLNISGWTTNGTGGTAFQASGLPSQVSIGGISNFTVTFNAAAGGSFAAALQIANDSPTTPYVINFSGSAWQISQSSGPYTGGNTVTITNGNFGTITNVMIGGVNAMIQGSGDNWVTITIPAVGSMGGKDVVIQTSDNGDTTLAGAYTVNPAGYIGTPGVTNYWTDLPGLPVGREWGGAEVLSNQVYYVAGYASTPGSSVSNVFRFNGSSWSEVAPLPKAAYAGSVAVLGDYLYSAGGYLSVGNVTITNMYRFDGTAWQEVAGLPQPRAYGALVTHSNKLYYLGGSYSGAKTNVYVFNGTSWMEGAGLPFPNNTFGAGSDGQYIYMYGGYNSVRLTNTYRFDGAAWTEISGMNYAPNQLGSAYEPGAVYAMCGYTDGGPSGKARKYDGTGWMTLPDLPVTSYRNVGLMYSNRLCNLGGSGAVSLTNFFTLVSAPTPAVGGVSPISGSWTGGYTVVLNGSNLCDGTLGDVTNVTLAGVSATVTDVAGSTQIVVTAGVASSAGLGDVRVFSARFGETVKLNAFTYLRANQAPLVFTPASPQAYLTTNALSVSGGSGTGDVSYAVLSGPGQIVSGNNLAVTAGTGTIEVRATKAQDDLYYETAVTGLVTAAKAGQTITFDAIADKVTTDLVGLEASASSGLGVAFAVGSGPASIADGTNLSFTGAGSVSIVASQAGDANWNTAPDVTNTFNVSKATAGVTLNDLSQTYDGGARPVTATTVPGGLTVDFTYDGNAWAPTNAGSYTVTGTVNEVMYGGGATGLLVVAKASADVYLLSLSQTYDGTAKSVTSTTDPSGLTVEFSYDGNAWAPTNVGDYAVTGTVNEANYQGSDSDTLSIQKASQTISAFLPTNGSVFVETDLAGLSAIASSGLAVTFTNVSGPGVITDGTNLSFTGGGMVEVVALQAGDDNWNPAPAVTNLYRVLGYYTLAIESAHGSTVPAVGVYTNLEGSTQVIQASATDDQGTTQYVCAGWVATENLDPAGGAGTQAVVTVNGAGTLTWLWTTNYWLTASAGPNGSVNVGNGWQVFGVTTQITATADQYYHFTNWSGSVASFENPLDVIMDAPKWITANFAADTTSNNVPIPWLVEHGFTNDFESAVTNDPDEDGIPTGDEYAADTDPRDGDSCLRMQLIWELGDNLRWAGGTGVVQYLEWSEDAEDDSSWVVLSTNLPPTAITNESVVPESFLRGFYRVRAVR